MLYDERIDCGDFIVHTRVYPKPKHNCVGVNSNCLDNKHIVLLDYDDANIDVVKKDISHIAKKFDLGPFFLYQTGPSSWHVRCPAKVTFQELTRILDETHIDPYALDEIVSYKRRNTHRVSPRGEKGAPKFILFVGGVTTREISRMHWEFFKKDVDTNAADELMRGTIPTAPALMYPHEQLLKFDDSKLDKLPMVVYATAKGESFGSTD